MSALLAAAGAVLAGCAPMVPSAQGGGWILLKHEPDDPLNAPLWAGDPLHWQRLAPQEVQLRIVRPAQTAHPDPAHPWLQGQKVEPLDALPEPWRQAMQDFGHDLREVALQPPVVPPFQAAGDTGIGRRLAPGDSVRLPLAVWGSDACAGRSPQQTVAGTAVLIRRGGCPYVEKAQAALRAGAAAMLIVNNEQPLNRVAGDCAACSALVLAALPRAPGEALIEEVQKAQAQGRTLEVQLRGRRALASALRVAADGRVGEVGFIPYPFNSLLPQPLEPFEQLALEARHLRFESSQRQALAE